MDGRWNTERQAVEFGAEIGEYHGVVTVPGRVFQQRTDAQLAASVTDMLEQCSGPSDVMLVSCSTAVVIRRQVSAPS